MKKIALIIGLMMLLMISLVSAEVFTMDSAWPEGFDFSAWNVTQTFVDEDVYLNMGSNDFTTQNNFYIYGYGDGECSLTPTTTSITLLAGQVACIRDGINGYVYTFTPTTDNQYIATVNISVWNTRPTIHGISDDRGNYYAPGETIQIYDNETTLLTPNASDLEYPIDYYYWYIDPYDATSDTYSLDGSLYSLGTNPLYLQPFDTGGAEDFATFYVEVLESITPCTPNWTCNSYGSCTITDLQSCNSVYDNNTCGENYTGDYTEFVDQVCDYCTPDWSCIGYETCVSPATEASCNLVNDTNTCYAITSLPSDNYTGNYTEYTTEDCSYSSGGSGGGWPDEEETTAINETTTSGSPTFSLFGSQGENFNIWEWLKQLWNTIKESFSK